ncbi:MAG: TetR/AcrR family transcriptional regulator [Ruminococcus sp.]|nr:TetR/AcrR family transcriptional regulator [Ruminococcus sp.]
MKDNPTPDIIKDALLRLLETRSYKDITMSEIAAEAYIGRRTCYRYFSSKDEIMNYAMRQLVSEYARELLDPTFETFIDAARTHYSFCGRNSHFIELLAKSNVLYFIEDHIEEEFTRIAYSAKHGTMDIDPETLSRIRESPDYYEFLFKISGFWRVTLLWIKQKKKYTPEQMLDMTIHQFIRVREELYF